MPCVILLEYKIFSDKITTRWVSVSFRTCKYLFLFIVALIGTKFPTTLHCQKPPVHKAGISLCVLRKTFIWAIVFKKSFFHCTKYSSKGCILKIYLFENSCRFLKVCGLTVAMKVQQSANLSRLRTVLSLISMFLGLTAVYQQF